VSLVQHAVAVGVVCGLVGTVFAPVNPGETKPGGTPRAPSASPAATPPTKPEGDLPVFTAHAQAITVDALVLDKHDHPV
jgi:hypothetical protein